MATVKKCDYPGCEKTDGVETFNLDDGSHTSNFVSYDLCCGHQTLLLLWIFKVDPRTEVTAHRELQKRGVKVQP